MFCCLWRNVETSCHKYFVVVSRHQQTPPLTTSDKCHDLPPASRPRVDNTWPVAELTARDECRYWLIIAISAYCTCIRRPCWGRFWSEYCHDVWYGKTRMCDYQTAKKIKDMFVCFDIIHERDRQTDRHTDGQTPRDGIGRTYALHRAGKTEPIPLIAHNFTN